MKWKRVMKPFFVVIFGAHRLFRETPELQQTVVSVDLTSSSHYTMSLLKRWTSATCLHMPPGNISLLILLADASETFRMLCNEASVWLITNTSEIFQRGRTRRSQKYKNSNFWVGWSFFMEYRGMGDKLWEVIENSPWSRPAWKPNHLCRLD